MDIKKMRRLKGLSQTDVAILMGVDRSTIVRWEKNPDSMKLGDYKKLIELLQGAYK